MSKPSSRSEGKILYIMGFGRSGTTILEVLLTNSPSLFSAGELTHIFRDAFQQDRPCACGEPASRCRVWSEVLKRCGWEADEIEDIRETLQAVEDHERFPLTAAGLIRESTMRRYREANARLLAALFDVSGGATVVDSSKYAGRALALWRSFPERVKVLCVTRSPAGLMNSFRKPRKGEQRQKSVVGAAAYYFYVLACLRVASTILGRDVLHVRYDDLVTDPQGTLKRIEGWSGHDLTASVNRLRQQDLFEVGHIVTGNRLRYQGQVRFDPAAATTKVKEWRARLAVGIMGLWGRLLGGR